MSTFVFCDVTSALVLKEWKSSGRNIDILQECECPRPLLKTPYYFPSFQAAIKDTNPQFIVIKSSNSLKSSMSAHRDGLKSLDMKCSSNNKSQMQKTIVILLSLKTLNNVSMKVQRLPTSIVMFSSRKFVSCILFDSSYLLSNYLLLECIFFYIRYIVTEADKLWLLLNG